MSTQRLPNAYLLMGAGSLTRTQPGRTLESPWEGKSMNSTVAVQFLLYLLAAALLTLMVLHNVTSFDVVHAVRSVIP